MHYGQLANLFQIHAADLQRFIGAAVRAPAAVVEDACQFAWAQLVVHCGEVEEASASAWLTTTATREVLRQLKRADREASLDAELEQRGDFISRSTPAADEVAELREQLRLLGELPARQGRILWLRAFGLSRSEVATRERCSSRAIERQLFKARRSLGALVGEAA